LIGEASLADEPARQRERDLARLAVRSFDLVIVGGGITGAGIARDAALRGLEVALVERRDFGSGTSSKSSKLVHGGLRYLQTYQIKLVFEGTNERALLMRLAPHLVRPLEFLIPAYRLSFYGLVSVGLVVYDLLALGKPPAGHRRYGRTELEALEPGLRRERLCGGLTYFDCATDDARLTVENVLDARSQGAVCVNHVSAIEPLRAAGGRLAGILARDERSGERFAVRGRVVVGAVGPWTDQLLAGFVPRRDDGHHLRPTKGVHLLVDAARLPIRRAVTMATRDQRIIFAIPAGRRTIVGTTDTDYRGDYDQVAATIEDVVYLLGTANFYFPEAKLRPEDVISTYAGLRPLIAASGSASSVPREHEIFEAESGLLVIAGGKLTTYRRMARETVDRAVARLHDKGYGEQARPCVTGTRKLPGAFAEGETLQSAAAALVARHQLPPDVARHLCESHGSRAEQVLAAGAAERIDPELPWVWAEIDYAIGEELALTVTDVLGRRVPLLLHSRDQGLGVAEEVVRRLARAHRLSEPEQRAQLEQYRREVELSRRFRQTTRAAASATG
jgi:glycerol-3-phosphate dehydrogenase